MDNILSRLIEVRVGPVEQAAKCACVDKAPLTRSGISCSANNAADTTLPYNPWHGSYTEHRLQMMSINDARSTSCEGLPNDRNSTLTDETAELRILPEHSPATAGDGASVTDEQDKPVSAAVQENASALDKKHPVQPSQGFQQTIKVDLTSEQRQTTETGGNISLNDLIEAMLNFRPGVHAEEASDVLSLQDMKDQDEDRALESARTAAGVDEELPKTIPDVLKNDSRPPPDSVDDKDVTAAIPDVSIGGSSLPRDVVTDNDVSLFMGGSDRQREDLESQPQPTDRQNTSADAQVQDSNNEQHSSKQDSGPESQRDPEQRVQENDVDHASNAITSSDKPISNLTTSDKSSPDDRNCKDTIAEPSKSMTTEQRREELTHSEKAQENEKETKPKTAELESRATVVPVSRQHISMKIILSATSALVNNDDVGHKYNDRAAAPKENLKQVEADDSAIRDKFKELRAECDTKEEKMDVDAEEMQHASEAKAEQAAIKSGKCCEDMLTRETDEVDSDPHHHQQQQQQQQQQWLKAHSESSSERTTCEEGRGTIPTPDPSTLTKDTDSATLLAVEDPVQSDHLNQEKTSTPDTGELPDQITTTTSTDNHTSSRGLSDDINEPTTEAKTTQEDSVTQNVHQQASDPLSEDVVGFPKSSTGHKESAQKDRRAKRLTKTVRIYHDLSTIIDYRENDKEAVTTIHLKPTRK